MYILLCLPLGLFIILKYFHLVCHEVEGLGIYSTIHNRILRNTEQILTQPQTHTICRKGQNVTGFSLNLKRQTISKQRCYVLAQCNSNPAENSKIKKIFDPGCKRAALLLLLCFFVFLAGKGQRQTPVHSLVRHE